MSEKKMPRLGDLFFAVCSTGIQNTSWKYADFEKVQMVEGQLAALHEFYLEFYKNEKPETLGELEKIDGVPVAEALSELPAENQPVAQKADDAPKLEPAIIKPEEAKEAPARPMPDEILEIVKAGIDVAKNPPKDIANVVEEDLPEDPDKAREAFDRPF